MRLSLAAAVFLATVASCAPADNSHASTPWAPAYVEAHRDEPLSARDVVPYNCAATNGHPLLKTFHMPEYSASASVFCSSYVMKTIVKTEGAIQTIQDITTTVPDAVSVTDVNTATVTDTDTTITQTSYVTLSELPTGASKRDVTLPTYPAFIPSQKHPGLVRAACKCILGKTPKTKITSTITTASVTDFTATVTEATPTVIQDDYTTVTATPTATVDGGSIYCGVPGCGAGALLLEYIYDSQATPLKSAQDCLDACNKLSGCQSAQYGNAGQNFCYMFSAPVTSADLGNLGRTDCANYHFYDASCTL